MKPKKQILNFKEQNQLINEIKTWISQGISSVGIAKHYYCTVTKVYSGDAYADVTLTYGSQKTVFRKMVNKSGVVLSIGDLVLLTAPFGDLSDMYIDKNQNPTVLLNMEHAIGTLTIGGESNAEGLIQILQASSNIPAMEIGGFAISLYDFLQTGLEIGSIITDRDIVSGKKTGSPSMSLIAEQGCSVKLGLRNLDGTTYDDGLVVNNNATDNVRNVNINLPTNIYPEGLTGTGFEATETGNNLYGLSRFMMGDITDVTSLSCINLEVSGTKNCKQTTKNFGDRLFYSYELGDSWLGDIGYGIINEGECVIAIDSIISECIGLNSDYIVKFYPDESCNFKITKTPNYFVITSDKDIKFGWELMGKRRGFEHQKLEYAGNLNSNLTQPEQRNVLLNDLGNENTDLLNKSLFTIPNDDI